MIGIYIKKNQDIVEANWRASIRDHPVEFEEYIDDDDFGNFEPYKHPYKISCKKCHQDIDDNTKNNMILKNGYSICKDGYISKNKTTINEEKTGRIVHKKPLCVNCWNKKITKALKFDNNKKDKCLGLLDGNIDLIKHVKSGGKYYREVTHDPDSRFDEPDDLEHSSSLFPSSRDNMGYRDELKERVRITKQTQLENPDVYNLYCNKYHEG